jgi:hypothetical protein
MFKAKLKGYGLSIRLQDMIKGCGFRLRIKNNI